jgi:hypothetical protein
MEADTIGRLRKDSRTPEKYEGIITGKRFIDGTIAGSWNLI